MSGFYSEGFRWLEIFLKSHQGEAGRLYLRKEGQDWLEYAAGGHQYRLTKIPLEEHTHYQLELSNCLASVACPVPPICWKQVSAFWTFKTENAAK